VNQPRRSVILRQRPDGAPTEADFALQEDAVPAPGPGEVLTRTIWLSIDPYMRGRLSGAQSYAEPVPVGGVLEGETVGEVIASEHPNFAVGDHALGARRWQSHSVSPGAKLVRLPADGAPLSAYLGVLGMPGVTAYSAITDIARPRAGEVVVVSAASGPVGSVAGQLAKRIGARVIGIAGGAAKCAFVRDELGFDDCLDHRGGDLGAALRAACPDGVDVYVENVGGAVQRAVFPMMRPFGRIAMIGMVAEYNHREPAPGPNLMSVVRKRLHIQGLIVSDKPGRFAEWRRLAAPWVRDGSLRYREDVVEGLENAPGALIGMLEGRNFGKLLVRVGPDRA